MTPAPFVQDRDLTLWHGEASEVLAHLAPCSVDVIVTSPPYLGLRDYGTGTWEGGDPNCDHLGPPKRTKAGFNERYFNRVAVDDKQSGVRVPYRDRCESCEARRVDSQIGLEATSEAYIASLVTVFHEARRVLSEDGTLWLNLGDSYSRDPRKSIHKPGHTGMRAHAYDTGAARASMNNEIPAKNLMFLPERVAMALQLDGWWVRQDVIWHKTNALPESVADRPGLAHEHVFMLTKADRYYYDREAVKVPAAWERWGSQTPRKTSNGDARGAAFVKERTRQGVLEIAGERNLRSVWSIPTEGNSWAACDDCEAVFETTSDGDRHEKMAGHTLAPHFAAYPRKLVETCLLASCPPNGTVLDPFMGSGTTMVVARALGLNTVGIELREAYCRMIRHRAQQLSFLAEPPLR